MAHYESELRGVGFYPFILEFVLFLCDTDAQVCVHTQLFPYGAWIYHMDNLIVILCRKYHLSPDLIYGETGCCYKILNGLVLIMQPSLASNPQRSPDSVS